LMALAEITMNTQCDPDPAHPWVTEKLYTTLRDAA
jgi:hypothetical protein